MKSLFTPEALLASLIVSLITSLVFLVPNAVLTPMIYRVLSGPPPVGIGERASDGELAAVVTGFTCTDARGVVGSTPVQGQLCTARVVVENHGNLAVTAEPNAALRLAGGDEVYPLVSHRGSAYSLIIFPDHEAPGRLHFDLPVHTLPGVLVLDINGDGTTVQVELGVPPTPVARGRRSRPDP